MHVCVLPSKLQGMNLILIIIQPAFAAAYLEQSMLIVLIAWFFWFFSAGFVLSS